MSSRLLLSAVFAGSFAFAGCATDTTAENDSDEQTLETASALSSESTDSDPVEDGVITDTDVSEAAAEADEQESSAPDPSDVGCGIRQPLRTRLKAHFDENGDGKLDATERAELRDFVDGAGGTLYRSLSEVLDQALTERRTRGANAPAVIAEVTAALARLGEVEAELAGERAALWSPPAAT